MIPISDNPPPGVVDRRDGSTKGECGITGVNNLFCKDQIANSSKYVNHYDEMSWSPRESCQMATCPVWGSLGCRHFADPSNCPVLKKRKETGSWSF